MREGQLKFLEAVFHKNHDFYEIYYNNFICSHAKALKEIYPVIYKLLGEDCFENLCQIYIPENISLSYKLQDYGSNFPDFLTNLSALKNLIYLSDLAKLEWAIHELYYAPDDILNNLKFVNSEYPVLSIWEFCKNPEEHKILNLDNMSGENIMLKKKGLDIIFIRANLS